MRLAFSTLGCPDWSLAQIVEAARRLGYEGVELRCLSGDMDLLRRPEFQPGEIRRTARFFADAGVAVCCIDTSCCFHDADEATRRDSVEVAVRHAELAAALAAPLIRVFPNEIPPATSRRETRGRIAAGLRAVAERLPQGVAVGLETHGDFATAEETVAIVRLVDHPAAGIVWDAANTTAAGESIAAAAPAVAPFLLHVHLRDARPVPGQRFWQPVLVGRGQVPVGEAAAALRALPYRGFVSFEWEKFWRPEIEEPEVALGDFAAAWQGIGG